MSGGVVVGATKLCGFLSILGEIHKSAVKFVMACKETECDAWIVCGGCPHMSGESLAAGGVGVDAVEKSACRVSGGFGGCEWVCVVINSLRW